MTSKTKHKAREIANDLPMLNCVWVLDYYETGYNTLCGDWHDINDGWPETEGMIYCPFCNGKIYVETE